jgi:hypothetical protein
MRLKARLRKYLRWLLQETGVSKSSVPRATKLHRLKPVSRKLRTAICVASVRFRNWFCITLNW